MQMRLAIPDLKIRYRVYFMTVVLAVLVFFIVINLTFFLNPPKAVICAALALVVVFEIQYIVRFKKVFHNHHSAIMGFILLLILIPVLGGDSSRGRMWIFILPLVIFYTQDFRTSLIFLSLSVLFALITQILSIFDLITAQVPYTLEQVIVFFLIALIACIYEKTIRNDEKIIKKNLYTDQLTNLANRRKLIYDLQCPLNSEGVILALINIDDFKEINDLFDASTGDKVIKHLSKIIKESEFASKDERIYRLHSDEFAVVFNCEEKRNCELFIRNLINDLSRPFLMENDEILITVSIGVSDCTFSPLVQADIALKKAKERKEHIVFFDKSFKIIEKYDENRLILLRLRKALETDNIIPFFQPVYDISRKTITRYESLVRLVDTEKVYAPSSFLEISKRSKLYHNITRAMINKTFEAFNESDYSFSININYDDILNRETESLLIEKIKNFSFPSRIMLELLETEKIEDCHEVRSFINQVKGFGCKIAVDDFGSGYSNFNYIISLNVDFIKIDSSLIKNIDSDFNSQIITKSIVGFAKEMGIKTIAEYVHNESVLKKIRELDIDYAQGYFIGKPASELQRLPSFAEI